MIGAGIFSNDVLVIDRSKDTKEGVIVVAAVNGEMVVNDLHKPMQAWFSCQKMKTMNRLLWVRMRIVWYGE